MPRYSPAIEEQRAAFYQSLSEKDRRRYAAMEACKLGRGGLSSMARVLRCDRHTIAQGGQELAAAAELQRSGIRRTGGGRKRSEESIPGLDAAFLQVVEHHTAGSPMNAAGSSPSFPVTWVRQQTQHFYGCVLVVIVLLSSPPVRRVLAVRVSCESVVVQTH